MYLFFSISSLPSSEIAKYLSGQEILIEDFHRDVKEKPPVKILEEYCKSARFPEPKYDDFQDSRILRMWYSSCAKVKCGTCFFTPDSKYVP